MSFNFSFRKVSQLNSENQIAQADSILMQTNKALESEVDIQKQISQYNKVQQQLLNQYYKKRHLLLTAYKSQSQLVKSEVDAHQVQPNFGTNKSINPKLIPIFKTKRQAKIQTPIELGRLNTNSRQQILSKKQLVQKYNNELYRQDIGQSFEEQSDEQSEYDNYLRLQQNKIQKQKHSLVQIEKRIENKNSNISNTARDQQSVNYVSARSQVKTMPLHSSPLLGQPFREQEQKFILGFAFLLNEILEVEKQKQVIRSKLRYKMYEVFKFFKFNDLRLSKADFIQSLQTLLSSKNFHNFQLNQIASLFYAQKQAITRDEFTCIFINTIKLDEISQINDIKRKQNTIELLKNYFCHVVEIEYFQNKIKSTVSDEKRLISNLLNQITNTNSFDSQDIYYFLVQKAKITCSLDIISMYLNRILKANKKKKFYKTDLYQWLLSK